MPSYYLHVDVIVSERDHSDFEKAVKGFLAAGGFGRVDLAYQDMSLLLALVSPEPFEFDSSGLESLDSAPKTTERSPHSSRGVSVYRYVNVWTLPILDLNPLMQGCKDDRVPGCGYAFLNNLVLLETQDFVGHLNQPTLAGSNSPTLPADARRFVRGVRQMSGYNFAVYINTLVHFFKTPIPGFGYVDTLLDVTNSLATAIELWETTDGDHTLSSFVNAAAQVPKLNVPLGGTSGVSGDGSKLNFVELYQALPVEETRSLFKLACYDPSIFAEANSKPRQLREREDARARDWPADRRRVPRARQTLVVGATGQLGFEIVGMLRRTDRPVRANVRSTADPSLRKAIADLGCEMVCADLKDPATLEDACRGIETVISTASSTLSRQAGDTVQSVDEEGQLALVDAAEKAGVKYFVFVSFIESDIDFALQRAKRRVEERLRASNMSFTILRPTDFFESWLSPALGFDPVAGKARIFGSGERPVSWISVHDVARFAVGAPANQVFARQVVPLGGPDALSPLQVLSIFRELGAPEAEVEYVTEAALLAQLSAATDPLAQTFAALMLSTAQGQVVDPHPAIDGLPGRLRTVRDFAAHLLRKSNNERS